MRCRCFLLAFTIILNSLADVSAADRSIAERIDAEISAVWKAENIRPAEQLSDTAFIRRVTLDLIGRVPTLAEVEAYAKSSDPNKRAALVDRLMSTPAYVRYQAMLFELMLNDRLGQGGKSNSGGSLREYLSNAIAENRPWDRMYREMLLPDESDPKQKGASDYLKPKISDMDRLTNDVSVAFYGVNVSCAQCHDHPLVHDWTQEHFYGMKGFLSRTFAAGDFLGERSAGMIRYKPTKGPERQARLMFLTGAVVESDTVREPSKDEQKKEKEMTDAAKASKKIPPPPAFSARAKLVEISLQPHESAFFSKAIVNRMWHRFFGMGLVNPLDQMHSENPPSHPALLKALAEDLEKNRYDLKRLIRGLVMSRTYSLASRYDSESQPLAATFAVARIKPLTPMQLAASLKIATSDPKLFEGPDADKKIEALETAGRGFASLFPMPGENFQVGVSEALLFSNSDRIMKELFAETPGTLLSRAKAEKDADAVNLIYRAIHNRLPNAEESKAVSGYLKMRENKRTEALRDVMWALCTGPEFRFNH